MKKYLFLSLSSICLFESLANAQAGSLDLTFGTNGIASCPVGTGRDDAQDMIIDANGKIVVAGFTEVTVTNFNFSAARFNSNGTLDATFGTGGTTIINTGSGADEAYSVAIDGSGRIYLAGLIWNGVIRNLGIVRLTSNGLPDNTWDGDGVWLSQTLYGEYVNDIEIDASGRIVIAGHGGLNDDRLVVLRLNSNAAYDATFGTGGRVELTGGSDEATSIAFDANNKIMVGAKDEFTIIRLNTNGTLDATFGTGGSTVVNPTLNTDVLNDITVDGSGNVVAVGHGGITLQADFIAVRVTSAGTIDNTFGTSGVAVISGGIIQDQGQAVAIDANGKIIIGGESTDANGTSFSVVRLNTNGTADNTFGTSGVAIVNSATVDNGYGMSIDGNGKIVIAGIGDGGSNTDFFVARLLTTGTISIIDTESSLAAFIFPNPSSGIFTVISEEEITSIEIYNVLGENISPLSPGTGAGGEVEINLSTQPKGIYFVQINSEKGSITKKIVIQ